MKKSLVMATILVWSLLLSASFAHSQSLFNSRQTSYKTYVYKITPQEARHVYAKGVGRADAHYFHSVVDSFPTDSAYHPNLPLGHYLKTYAQENRQAVELLTVADFDVHVFNNNTDLCVQVIDENGLPTSGAKVKADGIRLGFDKKTQSYIDRKSNRQGLLEINYHGISIFRDLKRDQNNPSTKRFFGKVFYGTPLKYLWSPLNCAINLQVDVVKSAAVQRPVGTVYTVKNAIQRFFRKLTQRINGSYRYMGNKENDGYMVFNKPKYLPGDTVKLKAFVLDSKERPIDKTMDVVLRVERKDLRLGTIEPNHPGAYSFQFALHDSLKLKLDTNYEVSLRAKDKTKAIYRSFKYEDYELRKINLSLRTSSNKQYYGKPFSCTLKGTDVNGLNLMDARLELTATTESVGKGFADNVFVPDTLWKKSLPLKASGETTVALVDSLFPNANLIYKFTTKLMTSDNQKAEQSQTINYYRSEQSFDVSLKQGNLSFTFQDNGEEKSVNAKVYSEDHYGHSKLVWEGTTPGNFKLNATVATYRFETKGLTYRHKVASQPSQLKCFASRQADSLFVDVQNPHNIPFVYHLYATNNEKERAYTDSLNLAIKVDSKKTYYCSVRYIWGGSVVNDTYRIPFNDKLLTVALDQPALVFPGQTTTLGVTVTDAKGKPAQGVDLTAWGLTQKFDYRAPSLPNTSKKRKEKALINNFKLADCKLGNHPRLSLDYESWRILSGIDSVEYYKFLYPGNKMYRFEYKTPQVKTQIAPFVVSNGELQPIHVIYIDSKPVYFSWTNHTQPYSFPATGSAHHIKLRTANKTIELKNVSIEHGKRLIICVDDRYPSKDVIVTDAKPELSAQEKQLLSRYLFSYKYSFGNNLAYITNNDNVMLLKNPSYTNQPLAGPVAGSVNFKLLNDFSLDFQHEPNFQYEFGPKRLKMRSTNPIFPHQLAQSGAIEVLDDSIMTVNRINNKWKDYLMQQRYWRDIYYNSGYGNTKIKLAIDIEGRKSNLARNSFVNFDSVPLNILLLKYGDHNFMNIYPGRQERIQLSNKGLYQLILLYSNDRYRIVDSIRASVNGTHNIRIKSDMPFRNDGFGQKASDVIFQSIINGDFSKPLTYEKNDIAQTYNQHFRYTGPTDKIQGYVFDAETKEPMIGVTVMVDGTQIGTITDMNGYYSIDAPTGDWKLRFAFIGYNPQVVNIGDKNIIDVELGADELNLSEVVVVAHGTQRNGMLTASTTSISTTDIGLALQGRLAGIDVSNISGSPGMRIRGLSALTLGENTQPLIIIDGKVFSGNLADLDPSSITNMQVLKDAAATSLYGTQAANGVIIISTSGMAFSPLNKGAEYDEAFYESAMQSSGIRQNFSDNAFWQPKLVTDNNGKASFTVTFPDDITSWDTFVLAMDGKKRSGQTKGNIKSYLPVMAQLSVPRFMVEGDTANFIGKGLNYSPDTITINTSFTAQGQTELMDNRKCVDALIDTFQCIAGNDSISAEYMVTANKGFRDGEKRHVPVFKQGLEVARGDFYMLDTDTSMVVKGLSGYGKITIHAQADALNVIETEIAQLHRYRYLCNEQLASKLKALLAANTIAKYKNETDKYDGHIERCIKLLVKNQNTNGTWGWWPTMGGNNYITRHVLEALMMAKQQGFKVVFPVGQLTESLVYSLESEKLTMEHFIVLHILKMLDAPVEYPKYITTFEKMGFKNLDRMLSLMELKQKCGLPIKTDDLKPYKRTTLFGNVYYADKWSYGDWWANDVQNTLKAYIILKNDTTDHSLLLRKMRNYLFELRSSGYWTNTYESARVIETILPDLLAKTEAEMSATVTLTGAVNKTITKFPYHEEFTTNNAIKVTKTGVQPVYLSASQHYWDATPKERKGDFEISTYFKDGVRTTLQAGKPVTLVAKVVVKKKASYVMVNIPIPGGCSYESKPQPWGVECHREYYRHETAIFCEHLGIGTHYFEVKLLPRYSGKYTLNPAKIELMYFPTFNANNELKKVDIR